MTAHAVHYSSAKSDWCTPDALFGRLNRVYQFDLDAAASVENALCRRFFTKLNDGLNQTWSDSRVWINPPYGRAIGSWTAKAAKEAAGGAILIVMLVPARTDTVWWHEAISTARVEFLRGRLRFKGAASSAPFPSALLFWNC